VLDVARRSSVGLYRCGLDGRRGYWLGGAARLDKAVLKVEGSVSLLDCVKNCTFSLAFLLCYEFVQFLTPSKKLTDPSTFILFSFNNKNNNKAKYRPYEAHRARHRGRVEKKVI
jgi:hypothetical protein